MHRVTISSATKQRNEYAQMLYIDTIECSPSHAKIIFLQTVVLDPSRGVCRLEHRKPPCEEVEWRSPSNYFLQSSIATEVRDC